MTKGKMKIWDDKDENESEVKGASNGKVEG